MKEILIDVALEGKRVALIENGELTEIYIESPGTERLVGNIYKGKVSSVLPGMQAAFIDIGHEKNAFLYIDDAIADDDEEFSDMNKVSIDKLLKPGQEITVQVVKEPIETKGPRVTTQVTLPGRHLVLLPNADYIGISRRISNDKERARLRKIAEEVKPKGMGLIVRTASENKTLEDFQSDVSFLLKQWKKLKKSEKVGRVPRCIHKDLSLVDKTVRDLFTPDIDKLVINDYKEYRGILELVDMITPKLKPRVSYYKKDAEIFDFYNVNNQLKKALARKVWLNCGGYIVIDKTEALTVIDVNTGKYVGNDSLEKTVLKTNIEAANEIAKQLRLRDIAGIIIIDFIDMENRGHQKEVLNTLKHALNNDRTKSIVVGMTGLGLIEMTRKKVRPGLNAFMTAECPYCEGTGTVMAPESIALSAEKKISEYSGKQPRGALKIEVHPNVAELLKGKNGKNLKMMQKMYKRKMELVPNSELHHGEVYINRGDI
ncbi:MAG: Rne/Rng family ribonuclease [Eubacteriales bacterium]|nr:Rne/Rng family ribonuclease [Eubacteriales bacterium]